MERAVMVAAGRSHFDIPEDVLREVADQMARGTYCLGKAKRILGRGMGDVERPLVCMEPIDQIVMGALSDIVWGAMPGRSLMTFDGPKPCMAETYGLAEFDVARRFQTSKEMIAGDFTGAFDRVPRADVEVLLYQYSRDDIVLTNLLADAVYLTVVGDDGRGECRPVGLEQGHALSLFFNHAYLVEVFDRWVTRSCVRESHRCGSAFYAFPYMPMASYVPKLFDHLMSKSIYLGGEKVKACSVSAVTAGGTEALWACGRRDMEKRVASLIASAAAEQWRWRRCEDDCWRCAALLADEQSRRTGNAK